jgi:pimeloyl-ACP methyl ester carboxylesterase
MPFMPFNILGIWLRGWLSIAIIAGGIYLLKRWYDDSHVIERAPIAAGPVADENESDGKHSRPAPAEVVGSSRRVFRFEPGANRQTAYLASALALLAWAFAGRLIGQGVSSLMGGATPKPGESPDDPREERTGEVHRIRRPDGSELRVECYGPADAPPIILTHGWGANSTEWYYPKKHLAGRFRIIVWDEPGLGLSKKPDDNDYRLENQAADLEAVLTLAGDRPAILVGHSIGGMITLTFCRLFPEALGRRVAGLVLAHTTYTNPVRTTRMAAFYGAIEKPLIVPLLHLTIALWPLVWLMNWLSYFNGSAHRSTAKSSFAGTETRGQLDFVTRFTPHARPDVLARGMFGMLAYDATATLPTIAVPVLTVVGDLDTTTLPEAGRFITRSAPRATLATLLPARHMGLIEHHGRFDQLVAEFADSCMAGGTAPAGPVARTG